MGGNAFSAVQRDSTNSPAPSLEGAQALAERVARAADQHQRELAEENDRLRRELDEQRRRQEEAHVPSSRPAPCPCLCTVFHAALRRERCTPGILLGKAYTVIPRSPASNPARYP